jgi:hypothetical protein
MKSISLDLQAHLEGELTTLAGCWRVTRRDRVEFFFTDHDRDLVIDGDTYLAAIGYSRTAISSDSTLSVDNADVEGLLDDDAITEEDLRAGRFDFAEVRLSLVNWADLAQGPLKLRRGWLGEVTTTDTGQFKTELRGMMQALSQKVGQVYTPECRADLGDARCGVPIEPVLIAREHYYTVGSFVKIELDGGEDFQAKYKNLIFEATTAGYSSPAAFAPAFNESPGGTTAEDGYRASNLLVFTGQPADTNTVTVGTKVYTFQTVLTEADGHVLIGGTFQDSVANLLAAMTLGAGAGTNYATATTAHTTVDFLSVDAASIRCRAKAGGLAGNVIALSETVVNAQITESPTTHLNGGLDGAVWTTREAWMRHAAVVTWGVKATATLSFTGIPANGQHVTVGAKTYTFQTALTEADGHVLIGATAADNAAHLLAAITLGAGAGTNYAAATTAHPSVTAYAASTTQVLFEALLGGIGGNAIATTENLDNAVFSGVATHMYGGTDDRKVLYVSVTDPRAADGWFDGGVVTWETGDNAGATVEVRTWVADPGIATLFLPAGYAPAAGDLLKIYPGCTKRLLEDCKAKFNNVINFRGEPYVPGQDSILTYPDAKS